jgi:hypothetical protein
MSTDSVWFDVHGRINTTNGLGVYYNHYLDAAGAHPQTANYPGYKAGLDVMASSTRRVLVTLSFVALPAPGFSMTAGQVQQAKDTLVDQVNALWNQHRLRMNVIAFDPAGRQPTGARRALDVEFRVRWVSSGGDYVLYAYPTTSDLPPVPGRSDRPAFVRAGAGSSRIEMHIAVDTAAWVYSHEFGHCIGLPDEYSHAGVQFIRPNGVAGQILQRPDAVIPANRQGNVHGGVRDPDLRTSMSTHSNINLMPRHLWPTALEVRSLLNRHGRHNKFGVDVVFSR